MCSLITLSGSSLVFQEDPFFYPSNLFQEHLLEEHDSFFLQKQ
jgi:hypothetical protein